MKKHLALTLAALLCASFLGACNTAPLHEPEPETENETEPPARVVSASEYVPATPQSPVSPAEDFGCVELEDGTLAVGYIGHDPHIVVPAEIDGKTVTAIAGNGFCRVQEIVETVYLPETIRVIETGAFQNCTKLSEINLPASLTSIRTEAFDGCTSLRHITLWSDCLHEDDSMIFSRSGLTSITLTDAVTCIPASAFSATQLREVVVPGSVKAILSQGFSHCPTLERVVLHEGLERIGGTAFGLNGDGVILELTIPASVTEVTEFSLRDISGLERVIFLGDAPTDFEMQNWENDHYTVYYRAGAKGFTTPAWCGYPCYPMA